MWKKSKNKVNKNYNAADLDAFMKIAASWQNNTLAEDFGGKNNDIQNYLNPAMNLYKKRERTQNWNHQEKKYLLELCRMDMRIIENKRLDAGLTAVKNKAWKIIHQKFSEAFGTDRTCNRLKEQWRRMKACTRNEILDYNNRVTRYGEETADRKKPSPFTFEIWEFMQNAKKQCKSETLDGVDYSKVPLALEEDFEYIEGTGGNDENESDDQKTPPDDVCDVRIKEEDGSDENYQYNNNGRRISIDHCSSGNDDSNIEATSSDLMNNIGLNNFSTSTSFNLENIAATLETLNALRNHLPLNNNNNNTNTNNNNINGGGNGKTNGHSSELTSTSTTMVQKKLSANKRQRLSSTDSSRQPLEINNPIGNKRKSLSPTPSLQGQQQQQQQVQQPQEQEPQSPSVCQQQSMEMKTFMEMQAKEHVMRMQILETQLQTSKYARDIVEINKTIALQKLHDIANRRMS